MWYMYKRLSKVTFDLSLLDLTQDFYCGDELWEREAAEFISGRSGEEDVLGWASRQAGESILGTDTG